MKEIGIHFGLMADPLHIQVGFTNKNVELLEGTIKHFEHLRMGLLLPESMCDQIRKKIMKKIVEVVNEHNKEEPWKK
jgi:hypothetical protein